MKYILAILVGVCIALMVNLNGTLGLYTNVYFSSFLVHVIAAIGTLIPILKFKEENNRNLELPLYYYCGGLIGGIIIVINNISFQILGVSVTLAMALAGQVTASFFVDSFGLMRMKVVPFNRRKIPGIVLMVFGIILMMVL